MLCVVSPVVHRYDEAALDVSVIVDDGHNLVAEAVIVGPCATVTSIDKVVLQPSLFVTVTEYVPDVVTVMLAVVSSVDHKNVQPWPAFVDNTPLLQIWSLPCAIFRSGLLTDVGQNTCEGAFSLKSFTAPVAPVKPM